MTAGPDSIRSTLAALATKNARAAERSVQFYLGLADERRTLAALYERIAEKIEGGLVPSVEAMEALGGSGISSAFEKESRVDRLRRLFELPAKATA